MQVKQVKDCMARKNRFLFLFDKPIMEKDLSIFRHFGVLSINRAFILPLVKQNVEGTYMLSTLLGGKQITVDFKTEAAKTELLPRFSGELQGIDEAH